MNFFFFCVSSCLVFRFLTVPLDVLLIIPFYQIKGNMLLAQKLEVLTKGQTVAAAAAPAPAAAAAAAPAAVAVKGDFKAAAAFDQIAQRMKAEGAAMVKKVNCVYRFDLTAAGGEQQSWVIDLKNGSGAVRACSNTEKADCMIAMKDADFLLLMTGKLNAQQAFMKGKLKIAGNMGVATKLSELMALRPKAKL